MLPFQTSPSPSRSSNLLERGGARGGSLVYQQATRATPRSRLRKRQKRCNCRMRSIPKPTLPRPLSTTTTKTTTRSPTTWETGAGTRFPVSVNREDNLMAAANAISEGSDRTSPVQGLNHTLLVVIVVLATLVFVISLGITAFCLRRRRRKQKEQSARQGRPLSEEEEEAQVRLSPLGSVAVFPRFNNDIPRPDSTTLPIQGHLVAPTTAATALLKEKSSTSTPPKMHGASGSPFQVENMLSRYTSASSSASNPRNAGSANSSSRADADMPAITALSGTPPTSTSAAAGLSRIYQGFVGPIVPPLPVVLQPTLLPEPPPPPPPLFAAPMQRSSDDAVARVRGNRPLRHWRGKSKSSTKSSTSSSAGSGNKLRKKIKRSGMEVEVEVGQGGEMGSRVAQSPISFSRAMVRSSAGSMGNWVSLWESSSDEEGGRGRGIGRRRRGEKKRVAVLAGI
ncbi:hypothetical protein L873DRAFT_1337936 [Choiromyces venosus 120613-1]|uniref:Uncharacterized protein n=1 Tax=Choiromyces venosus 120613-1 TaxID=1336337 RepID=A0A3N4JA46_9PEZI|nr:hypothetical protein L873DRAFT_1337936 [Choiromyces venosus 120613-1]